jgi:hypothetical protein
LRLTVQGVFEGSRAPDYAGVSFTSYRGSSLGLDALSAFILKNRKATYILLGGLRFESVLMVVLFDFLAMCVALFGAVKVTGGTLKVCDRMVKNCMLLSLDVVACGT